MPFDTFTLNVKVKCKGILRLCPFPLPSPKGEGRKGKGTHKRVEINDLGDGIYELGD